MTTELTLIDLAAILEDSADELETNGWCQRRASNDKRQHCMIGAITSVCAGRVEQYGGWGASGYAMNAVAVYMKRAGRPESLPNWNDAPGRKAEEVIDVLKGAAKAIRNGELVVETGPPEDIPRIA